MRWWRSDRAGDGRGGGDSSPAGSARISGLPRPTADRDSVFSFRTAASTRPGEEGRDDCWAAGGAGGAITRWASMRYCGRSSSSSTPAVEVLPSSASRAASVALSRLADPGDEGDGGVALF